MSKEKCPQSVYKLGIRFSLDERAKLQDLTKKAGLKTIPEFVQHAIESYGKWHPEVEKIRQREIHSDARNRELEERAKTVALAHEEILDQFRLTIQQMGATQDKLANKKLEAQVKTYRHELQALRDLLGVREGIDLSIRAIKELKEAAGEDLRKIADALAVDVNIDRCIQVIGVLCEREIDRDKLQKERDRLKLKFENTKETLKTFQGYYNELLAKKKELMSQIEEANEKLKGSESSVTGWEQRHFSLNENYNKLEDKYDELFDGLQKMSKTLGVPATAADLNKEVLELKVKSNGLDSHQAKLEAQYKEFFDDRDESWVEVHQRFSFFRFVKLWWSFRVMREHKSNTSVKPG